MRFLVVYAHPSDESFHAAVHRCVVRVLNDAGHEVDDCDLYAEKFQPILSREEMRHYHDPVQNEGLISDHVGRLRRADGIVFVFPTWWYGVPAILKGYFDRVWVPGVTFNVIKGGTEPLLRNIVRLAVVTSYGSPWWFNTFLIGDPNRKFFMRGVRRLLSSNVECLWLAQYGMDGVDAAARDRFMRRVSSRLKNF